MTGKFALQTNPNVAVARNDSYMRNSVQRAFRDLLDRMTPSLPSVIRTGDQVLIKPYLRNGGGDTKSRMVSHPEIVKMVIEAIKDCGAVVSMGDVTPSLRNGGGHSHETWIHDIARVSGIKLVSFAKAGARHLRGRLIYPRTYLISRAALDVDKIVSCANFQPSVPLTFSGSVKNMFNVVVGNCRQHLHNLFSHPDDIARVIVDVCSLVKPAVTFLDLTTVRDPAFTEKCLPVGLILAGTDPVALDAVAAQITDFGVNAPTVRLGGQMGLGCAIPDHIPLSGLDLRSVAAVRINQNPSMSIPKEGLYDKSTRFINNVVLPPRPAINHSNCSRCGNCMEICPVRAIDSSKGGALRINTWKCANCHLCIQACPSNAIDSKFGGVAKIIRRLMNRSTLTA